MIIFVSFWSIVNTTRLDLYFLYSSSQAMLQLSQSVREHLFDVYWRQNVCNYLQYLAYLVFKGGEKTNTLSSPAPVS